MGFVRGRELEGDVIGVCEVAKLDLDHSRPHRADHAKRCNPIKDILRTSTCDHRQDELGGAGDLANSNEALLPPLAAWAGTRP